MCCTTASSGTGAGPRRGRSRTAVATCHWQLVRLMASSFSYPVWLHWLVTCLVGVFAARLNGRFVQLHLASLFLEVGVPEQPGQPERFPLHCNSNLLPHVAVSSWLSPIRNHWACMSSCNHGWPSSCATDGAKTRASTVPTSASSLLMASAAYGAPNNSRPRAIHQKQTQTDPYTLTHAQPCNTYQKSKNIRSETWTVQPPGAVQEHGHPAVPCLGHCLMEHLQQVTHEQVEVLIGNILRNHT